MYCWKCGKKLNDDAKFCFACGTKVELPEQDPVDDAMSTEANSVPVFTKPQKAASASATNSKDSAKKSETSLSANQKTTNAAPAKRSYPTFPKPKLLSYIMSSIFISGTIIFLGVDGLRNEDKYISLGGDPHFQGACLIVFGIAIFIFVWVLYSSQYKRYRMSVKKPQEYAALREKELKEQHENYLKQKAARERELAMTPACPVCGKKDITRLSTMNRSLSIGLFGLSSAKIGKQYQCNNCKHLW